jgi:hypothetical protein
MEDREWSADISSERVAELSKGVVRDICYSTETREDRLHHALAHILAGIGLLHSLGVFRHVVKKWLDTYFNIMFGRLN